MSQLPSDHTIEKEAKTLTADESRALLGLRGLVAVHIMLFHTFWWSKLEWELCGSSAMPIFFILSGFFLTYTSAKVKYTNIPCCAELCYSPEDKDTSRMNARHFYRRRIARTLPLYWFCNIGCIPLIGSGYGYDRPEYAAISIILTVTCTTTWFAVPFLLSLTSWFVPTIWFYYWCYPSLLPKLQAYSIEQKLRGISNHFWIQMIVGSFFFGFVYAIRSYDLAFCVAAWWPPSRFSVFIMGVLGGLIRLESPWLYRPRSSILFWIKPDNAWTCSAQEWATAVDRESAIVTISFVLVMIGENFTVHTVYGISSHIWFQFLLPISQLTIVYGLSMDNGLSRTSRMLRSRVVLFFGTISYALYLVHEPIIWYICWITYGTQSKPSCIRENSIACEKSWEIYDDQRLQPVWCIPVHLLISIILAVFLHHLVEKPARNCLRPENPQQIDPKVPVSK